jgi:hypothetical protein
VVDLEAEEEEEEAVEAVVSEEVDVGGCTEEEVFRFG